MPPVFSRPNITLQRPASVHVIRNIEYRRYSILFSSTPAIIAFLHRQDAEFFKSILDTQYTQTGIWPMISLEDTLNIYQYNQGSSHSSVVVREESYSEFENECNRSYMPYFLVSAFCPSHVPERTLIKGQLMYREIDEGVRYFLETLL